MQRTRTRPTRRRAATTVAAATAAAVATALTGCAAPDTNATDKLSVVTTTGILADLVHQVAGDRVEVTALVPEGADPHSHEPTLRDVRNIVYADAAFTNYLMLEEQSLIKAIDTNLPEGVPNVALAEAAVKYAAEVIPLVEDVSLDTAWLGLRVRGTGEARGATRSSAVTFTAHDSSGPGDMFGYLTGSFGDIDRYFDSSDGFSAHGPNADTVTLPPDTHTHLSWAFTKPGYYTLDLAGSLTTEAGKAPIELADTTLTFAVGVDPHTPPNISDPFVLDSGHSDIVLDLDQATLSVVVDHEQGTAERHQEEFDPEHLVVEVPTQALHLIPGDPAYRFLGRPGTEVYQLPQAVLGKHVHGEIDPHLWQNVKNAMAYVQIIRDTLIGVDPQAATVYHENANQYLEVLERLDDEVRNTLAEVPPSRRTLVTTHDAYGYLARAYDFKISGFVAPNPSVEPSLAERKRLTETIRNLEVPAVFLEPNLASRVSTLTEVAHEQNIRVCKIYGDAFDEHVHSYVEMMRYNATSIRDCLGSGATNAPQALQSPDRTAQKESPR